MGVADDFTIVAEYNKNKESVGCVVEERKALIKHRLGEMATHKVVQRTVFQGRFEIFFGTL